MCGEHGICGMITLTPSDIERMEAVFFRKGWDDAFEFMGKSEQAQKQPELATEIFYGKRISETSERASLPN